MNTSSQLTQQEIFELSEKVKKMTIAEVTQYRNELQNKILRLNNETAVISGVINGIQYNPNSNLNMRPPMGSWDPSMAFMSNMNHMQNTLSHFHNPNGINQFPQSSDFITGRAPGITDNSDN